MPTTINLGTGGIIAGRYGLSFGPQLWSYRIREVGLHAAMVSRAATLQAAGWVGDVSPLGESPKSVLTATYAGSSNPALPDGSLLTTWNLSYQYSDVAAMNSEAYKTWLAAESVLTEVQAGINYKMQQPFESLTTGEFAGWNATRQAWYISIQEGWTRKEARAVLSRVKIYPAGTAQAADWTDVAKIWTTAQIEAAETIPSIIGSLPANQYWLKTPGDGEFGTDGRYTVVTSWIQGHYPSHMYTYKS